MEDRLFQTTSMQLLENLRNTFLNGKTPGQILTHDEQHFFEGLEDTLAVIRKRETIDNAFLLALEKVYKRTCILIGLTHFAFDEETQQAWRAFTIFYDKEVVTRLRLFGGHIGM